MYDEQTPVLIVGGSLVGLSTSLFLSWHGIPSVLVERRPAMWVHPRAWGYNPRTMELFREVGLEEAIDKAGPVNEDYRDVIKVDTLAGQEFGRYDPPHLQWSHRAFSDLGPASYSLCTQNKLEPILRARAEELGSCVRLNTELVSFEHDADGVTAILEDRASGTTHRIRTRYLVAADGHRSRVRRLLGIPTHGRHGLAHIMNILFQADLSKALRGRTFFLCHVENPRNAVLNPIDKILGTADDLWQLHVGYEPESGQTAQDFTDARCVELVRRAVGVPDQRAKIVSTLPWEVGGWLAERFSQGRVFLVGDAAHVMPPAGGFGVNTGIQDGHNLAWKLAFVIKGMAGPELLATYDAERRPVVAFTIEQSVLRSAHQFRGDDDSASSITDDRIIMFGYRYRSSAVLDPGDDNGHLSHDSVRLTGRPGTRVPYVVLERKGERTSTIDLISRHFLLLTGVDGGPWNAAARHVANRYGIDVEAHLIGACGDALGDLSSIDGRFLDTCGITPSGAVLIRPDGFVAWRTRTINEHPERTLEHALTHLLHLG